MDDHHLTPALHQETHATAPSLVELAYGLDGIVQHVAKQRVYVFGIHK